MNVEGYHKAELLAGLFNRAIREQPIFAGYQNLDVFEAQLELDSLPDEKVTYLYGRPLFLNFNDLANFDVTKYNEKNGNMAAEQVIKKLNKA